MYDHFYSMCDDNMDIITVLRDMIDVRDGFKTCAYYTHNDVLKKKIVPLFLLQCVNKDIIIIITDVGQRCTFGILLKKDIPLQGNSLASH